MSIFERSENFTVFLRKYPITSVILLLNIVYFALIRLVTSASENETIFRWGAFYKPAIEDGEYYRFLTSIFMHFEISHLLFNLFSIFLFAAVLEKLIGRFKFMLLYLISGIAGNLLTYAFDSPALSLGASGAIFGVFGAFLYLSRKSNVLDTNSRRTIISLVVVNLVLTFILPDISITGHLGGFVAGLLLSVGLRINRVHAM